MMSNLAKRTHYTKATRYNLRVISPKVRPIRQVFGKAIAQLNRRFGL